MKKIVVDITSEEQVNQEFIDAWHRAERHEIAESEQRLYFLEPETLFHILSKRRLLLLHTLRAKGKTSVRGLSQLLQRNYNNVSRDVRILKAAGLIEQSNTDIFVPYDRIRAEIDLAAAVSI